METQYTDGPVIHHSPRHANTTDGQWIRTLDITLLKKDVETDGNGVSAAAVIEGTIRNLRWARERVRYDPEADLPRLAELKLNCSSLSFGPRDCGAFGATLSYNYDFNTPGPLQIVSLEGRTQEARITFSKGDGRTR
jgi:hypothetical protein